MFTPMTNVNSQPEKAQEPSSFKKSVKLRLVDLDISVTDLSKRIRRSRTATSGAINHPTRHPAMKVLIRKELGL
ncbi:hypothetical protein CCP3SC15_990010 [Gammaproteobacteria bacterium]